VTSHPRSVRLTVTVIGCGRTEHWFSYSKSSLKIHTTLLTSETFFRLAKKSPAILRSFSQSSVGMELLHIGWKYMIGGNWIYTKVLSIFIDVNRCTSTYAEDWLGESWKNLETHGFHCYWAVDWFTIQDIFFSVFLIPKKSKYHLQW